MSSRNTNIQNQPKRLSVATSVSSNIQNETTRTIQMMPSLAIDNVVGIGTVGAVSTPRNVSSSHYVSVSGTPLLCFSNKNSSTVQGYYVQLQPSGGNLHEFIPAGPPMTSNNAASTLAQSQQKIVSEQHQQAAPVRSTRMMAPSTLATQIGSTDPCHTICPQKPGGRQESGVISQLAIMQAYTPQPQRHVLPGSQTFAQAPFRLQGIHPANNPQGNAQQLIRFQLYNVGQLLQSHSPQAQPEMPMTVSRQVPQNRSLTTESSAVSQWNANPMRQQDSYQSDANHFQDYTENNQDFQNQLVLYPNSLNTASHQTLNSSSTHSVNLPSVTSQASIQLCNVSGCGTQGIMQGQPQMINLISSNQRGNSPLTTNTTSVGSTGQSVISQGSGYHLTNTRGINGQMVFRQQVGTQTRVQRIISIQTTDQGIRRETPNSVVRPPGDMRRQTPSAQPQSVILRPTPVTPYANQQMKIYPQPPNFQQTSFTPTPDTNFQSSNVIMAPLLNDQLLQLAQTTQTHQPITTSQAQQKFTSCLQNDLQSTPSKLIDSNTTTFKASFEDPEMFIVQPQTHNTNRQPTQCTQLGIESQLNPRTSSYQTSFQQPIYHSVPAQTFDTQDFQHLINSQFDHPQSIRSLSPNKGLQYLFPSACDDAELAGGLSHFSDPEMLDIRSPLLQYSKSETERPAVNTIALNPIPAATFYKPFIFRKTLPAGNNNKSHEETNNNKNTDECKHSVLNHNILGATNEINDAVQKKSKSIRRRKQPLKKEQKENGTTPDKQSRLPNTIISQSPGTPSTTAPTGIKNATKKTKKSKGPALVTKSPVAAEMSNQNESALNQLSIKSTSKSLAPKTHKRPMKHLSNDVTIVRESNQLSIMKNAAADADVINDSITCPVPKKKRRKKVTDNEVHKGIKSGSAGPNIVLDATVINDKSEVDLNRRNGERPKHNLQENVGNNVTVQNDEEGPIRADEPLDTVGVNAGAEWKTSFDKLVKCVIKGFTVNREASARGLNALHKFTVNPSNRHVDIVRKDFLATLIRCVSPKVKLTVNEVLTRHGVFTFDVDVLGVDFVNYPKVKVQLTPDYPADLPVFLDLESTKDSIENAENKRKFVYAISLMRKKLRTIPDHCYRLPVVIKIWSQALRFVTIHNVALQIEDREERIMHTLLK